MKHLGDPYSIHPFPKMRRFALDAGILGHRRHMVHGFLELDVTQARGFIREYKKLVEGGYGLCDGA